jgi:hypothetical protein
MLQRRAVLLVLRFLPLRPTLRLRCPVNLRQISLRWLNRQWQTILRFLQSLLRPGLLQFLLNPECLLWSRTKTKTNTLAIFAT